MLDENTEHYFYFVPDSLASTRAHSGRWERDKSLVQAAELEITIEFLNIPGKLSSIIGLI